MDYPGYEDKEYLWVRKDPRKYKNSKWFQLMLEQAHYAYPEFKRCVFCVVARQEFVHQGGPEKDDICPYELCVFDFDHCIRQGKELYEELFESV